MNTDEESNVVWSAAIEGSDRRRFTMDEYELLALIDDQGVLDSARLDAVLEDERQRLKLVHLCRQSKCRKLALRILEHFIDSTREEGYGVSDHLRLACYLVAVLKHVEDVQLIWEAKCINFDTACGIDIQLLVACGVDETIEYLSQDENPTSQAAIKRIKECSQSGDFESLEEYFSVKELPWYV